MQASTADTGVPLVAVDYADVQSLKAVLEQHKIHTVISCVGVHDQAIADVQAAVIQAAEKSSTTKRFIASNWGTPYNPEYVTCSLLLVYADMVKGR